MDVGIAHNTSSSLLPVLAQELRPHTAFRSDRVFLFIRSQLPDRVRLLAATLVLPGLCYALTQYGSVSLAADDPAPAPRVAGAAPQPGSPADIDRILMSEVKTNSEIMKNLEYLSDVIGPRLTGSKALERANEWTAAKMKEYGLENVRLEPWEIPIGWERGTATMKVIEPNTGRPLLIASAGWAPGTKGKVIGDVVIMKARTKDDLAPYKGKLKNAVILRQPPATVAPVTDRTYGPVSGPPAKKDEKGDAQPEGAKKDGGADGMGKKGFRGKRDAQPETAKKDGVEAKKDDKNAEAKKDDQPPRRGGGGFGGDFAFQAELNDFLKAEGAACIVLDSAKPHGLLVTTGSWPRGDRGSAQDALPRVYMAHEHYAMLWRLVNRPAPAETKVEVEISNTFVPGPIVVSNTIGEVRGSEKPDEYVVVGAHLDSWDLASGTTDNGTGSCVVLETARVVAALAKQGQRPKRTIRFCLFTGEEEGLWGSKKYVEKHKDELNKHSVALVHDTGTGKVLGFGLQGRAVVQKVLEPELESLKAFEGWKGLDLGRQGGTDHLPFESANVPGFACRQDVDEYRLTHHTQTDTFDHAKGPNLIQGAQVMAVTCVRIANMPELLPRK